MKLYFLRHGIALDREEWRDDDSLRPLTDAGREQLRWIAAGLALLRPRLDALYSSPFARAAETARIVGETLGVDVTQAPELQSGCSLDDLAVVLARRADARRVMLVGHEPDFSEMIGRLMGTRHAAVSLKKGACCRVDLSGGHEQSSGQQLVGKGTLAWLLTPKHLAQLGGAPTVIAAEVDEKE